MTRHRVFLVPGFFGFANFGDIKYFSHVREVLGQCFAEFGHDVEIHYVRTLPTASLPRRAAAIADAIAESGSADTPIHLIGHSTGGLDARLFSTPGVRLPSKHEIEPLASGVQSIVAIAAPHHGTPLASIFATLAGQRLLRVLSVLTLHGIRLGTMPLPALLAIVGSLPRIGQLHGPGLSILDQVYRQLLKDFDADRRDTLEDFIAGAASDQRLIPQLAHESLHVFNATTTERPTTRCGCVVTQARPPSLRSTVDVGLSPTGQAIYALFRALYGLASAMPENALPPLSNQQRAALEAAYGATPGRESNDTIVPTLSQIWGHVIHATWADHLDIIGHFSDPDHSPPHVDWLSTQSKFSRSRFEALWHDVARFMLEAEN